MNYWERWVAGISCFVFFNSDSSIKTVDVIFKREKDGESFECKVNPADFEEYHIDNLKDIFIRSDKRIFPKIASFSSSKAVEMRLAQLNITLGTLKYFGRDNLKEICLNWYFGYYLRFFYFQWKDNSNSYNFWRSRNMMIFLWRK